MECAIPTLVISLNWTFETPPFFVLTNVSRFVVSNQTLVRSSVGGTFPPHIVAPQRLVVVTPYVDVIIALHYRSLVVEVVDARCQCRCSIGARIAHI